MMDLDFREFWKTDSPVAVQGELQLRPRDPAHQDCRALTQLVLEHDCDALVQGKGPIERIVVQFDSTLNDMLAATSVERLFAGEPVPQGVSALAEYAPQLKRPSFVRPTHWKESLPSFPKKGLSPSLKELPFQRIALALSPARKSSGSAFRRIVLASGVVALLGIMVVGNWFTTPIAVGPLPPRPVAPNVASALPNLGDSLGSLANFERAVEPHVIAHYKKMPEHWRSIAPSLYYFILNHKSYFQSLNGEEQFNFVGQLANFIFRKRKETGGTVVIGPGRSVIAILDPRLRLDPEQVTAIAKRIGAPAEVFKLDNAGESAVRMSDDFLMAVRRAAESDKPATVVVLGHGTPEQVVNDRVRYESLGDALLAGAKARTKDQRIDLSNLVLIIDACFSADLVINLGKFVETQARRQGFELESLPIMISSVNRNREGHAEAGEKLVNVYWGAVLELFYNRQPRPEQVTLRDFFVTVDNYMYGFGRTPIVVGEKIVDYKVIDPEMIQDPVCFVPLKRGEVDELRRLLGIAAEVPLPAFFDIGAVDALPSAVPGRTSTAFVLGRHPR